MQAEFNSMQKTASKLSQQFAAAGYKSKVAQKMVYDEKTIFNEYNVISYMAEMEEYMTKLVRDVASAHGSEFAVISGLPLEMLPTKVHVKAPMQVDVVEPIEQPTVGTEDELITDKEELLKKYLKIVKEKEASQP